MIHEHQNHLSRQTQPHSLETDAGTPGVPVGLVSWRWLGGRIAAKLQLLGARCYAWRVPALAIRACKGMQLRHLNIGELVAANVLLTHRRLKLCCRVLFLQRHASA